MSPTPVSPDPVSPGHPNPLLPVLQALDPARPWPESLDGAAAQVLDLNTGHLIQLARDLASESERRATPASGIAPPSTRADLQMFRWMARSVHAADQVMRGLLVADQAGEAVRLAVTAAVVLREAEFATGASAERHHKSVLNRALAAADWVRLSLISDPVNVRTAAQAFLDHLPPGWRWNNRPDIAAAQARAQVSFDVIRERTGSSSQPRCWEGHERIQVTGKGSQTVTVMHMIDDNTDDYTRLTWGEVCQYIARSQVRDDTTTQPDTA